MKCYFTTFNLQFKLQFIIKLQTNNYILTKRARMDGLRYRDNQRLLSQVEGSHIENIFLEKKQEDVSQLSMVSENNAEYSPKKQKVKDQLNNMDIELRQMKKRMDKYSKWDNFRPYSFAKLSSEQKDNVFQSLFQDFLSMKGFYNQYTNKYTIMYTKLQRIQAEMTKFKKKSLTKEDKIQIYKEQNKENKQLKEQIQRLHQKIIALTSSKPASSSKGFGQKPKQTNNKTFTSTQKAIFPATQNIKAELQQEKKNVRQLLQVIDELRRTKMNLEAELKEKNLNRGIENISLRQGERPGRKNNSFVGNSEQRWKEYADELMMWKEKAQEMELCYNKMNEDKDRIINELNRELIELKESQRMKKNVQRSILRPNIDSSINEARMRQLQDTNTRLQNQLRLLTRNPLFKDNTQTIDLKKLNSTLEQQLKKLKVQLSNVKQQKTKFLAQLELKSRQSQMLKAQNTKIKNQLKDLIQKDIKKQNSSKNDIYRYDENDYYRKLLNLVKLDGDDPVWKKYNDLVMPVFTVMTQTQLKDIAQSLWKSKLELLAHLEKAQIQMKTNKQTNDSKLNVYIKQRQRLEEQLRVTKARLDEWMIMDRVNGVKRDFQVYEHQGIKYNDSISVFEDDQDEIKALDHNQNFFDLYLGQLNLDQTNILRHPQNKIKSISNIISFLTVDFYNHPTQHSNFSEGLTKKLLNNYSFKVQINSYFIKFLSKNCITLELWSPQGTSTVLFGKGQVWLSDLMTAAAKDISNVVRGKCPIYSPNKVLIATVEYRMRMRLPITPFMEWASNKQQLSRQAKSDPFAINQRKKLAITIQRAEGLIFSGSTFVYFNIQNQDFFTEPCEGNSPFWDYHREIDVVLDEDFCSYLKENYVQFTLFDDDKEVNEDVIGVAKANLTPLLQSNQPLDLVIQIQDNRFSKVGKLKIKAYWV